MQLLRATQLSYDENSALTLFSEINPDQRAVGATVGNGVF